MTSLGTLRSKNRPAYVPGSQQFVIERSGPRDVARVKTVEQPSASGPALRPRRRWWSLLAIAPLSPAETFASSRAWSD